MTAQLNPRWISVVDTAKLVRAALKAAFPGQTFSVRSSKYSMGASIDVKWTDGPTEKEVRQHTEQYSSADFDGTIDLATFHHHWLFPDGHAEVAYSPGTEGSRGIIPAIDNRDTRPPRAEYVSFGADYVQLHRRLSSDFLRQVGEAVCQKYGRELPELKGGTQYVGAFFSGGDVETIDLIHREAYQTSAYVKPRAQDKPKAPTQTPSNGATIGEYKGHPTITLPLNKRGFTFGLAKARLILAHIEEIQHFVEEAAA